MYTLMQVWGGICGFDGFLGLFCVNWRFLRFLTVIFFRVLIALGCFFGVFCFGW